MAEPRQSRDATAEDALVRLRERIDAIDGEILAQLNERARVAQEVGRLKQTAGAAVYASGREQDVVARLERESTGPFPRGALSAVFREIISATRAVEQQLRVAYLGPEGTFSHLAAFRQFGRQVELTPVRSIGDVFDAVERGKTQLGVVPVENTTDGIVTQTYDRLPEFAGALCGELQLRVSLDLLSRSGQIERVRRVVSHPQPLAQSRAWLDRHLAGAERVEAASTAAAARLAAEDDSVAAICSPMAAEAYGLRTVEASIEDRTDNTTRFLLIGCDEPAPSGNDLTSAVFTLRKDESGALRGLLEPFARCAVNLTALQLRPIHGKPWEYYFFVDLEGHRADPKVKEALGEASKVAHSHRVLGSFPRATRRRD